MQHQHNTAPIGFPSIIVHEISADPIPSALWIPFLWIKEYIYLNNKAA